MRERRSKLEIYLTILEVVSKEKLTITHVMYKTRISYYQAKRFLDYLIEQKMVNKTSLDNTIIYEITEKGKNILEHFKPIKESFLIER